MKVTMRKLSKTLMLCALIIAMLVAFANARKVTKLHFYVQDLLGGPNQSVWEVARAEITSTSPTSFGLVRVADDQITTKPDSNSTELGRLQGLITFANFKESAPIMNLNVVFTSGIYSGSTLCLVGRNSISDQYREMAIVGGTGVFQMARCYVNSSTYSIDSTMEHVVLEYNLYVVYEKFGESSELFNM